MFRIKVQKQKIWSETCAKLKLNWNEKFSANLAKKLVCFFAWAIEKEAEQIPFASFRFKANLVFFLQNRQPIVLGPSPHEENTRGGWKTVYVIF